MKKIWLIGTGTIGIEYARVLQALEIEFIAIGRGEKSALEFENKTGHKVIRGGLSSFLESKPNLPIAAIVSVGIEVLTETAVNLLNYGVKKILQEKPGIGWLSEIDVLTKKAKEKKAIMVLAYNRRFYSSVFEAEKIIKDDGGIASFNFEFTEWSHLISQQAMPEIVSSNWIIGNSSHVIDTAFFLGGWPSEISCYHGGSGNLFWHPSSSVYAGAGISEKGAFFSYQANWQAPGRWSVELLTKKHRLYLKPMEGLQIQNIGSVAINPVEFDNKLDIDFKPGFYLQTKAFINDDYTRFCTIDQQKNSIEKYYLKISGYKIN